MGGWVTQTEEQALRRGGVAPPQRRWQYGGGGALENRPQSPFLPPPAGPQGARSETLPPGGPAAAEAGGRLQPACFPQPHE